MDVAYESFDNAEEVWFWFCGCLLARNDGLRARGDFKGKKRPIEVADVHRILKRMKVSGHINNKILRTMFKWGEQGTSPYYNAGSSEVRMWEIGINNFEAYLKSKRILS